jgi:formylglycine-generating enzyme required for sulfatase activity
MSNDRPPKTVVGRADILRVLEQYPDPLPVSLGNMLGYAPQTTYSEQRQAPVPSEDLELLAPTSTFVSGPQRHFWYLHRRELLALSLQHEESPLPSPLRRVAPLSRRQQRLPQEIQAPVFFYSKAPSAKANNIPWNRVIQGLAQLRPLTSLVQVETTPCPIKKKSPQVERLLVFLSMAEQADQSLVGDLVRLLSLPRPVEEAVWFHPDIQAEPANRYLCLKTGVRTHYHKALQEEKLRLREKVLVLLEKHHARSLPAFFAVELLHSRIFLSQDRLEWLEHFLLRFLRTWFHRTGEGPMQHYARHLLTLFPKHLKQQYTWPSLLYGLLQREELRQGAVIPPEYRPELVCLMAEQQHSCRPCLLVQEGEDILLINSPSTGICLLKGSQIAALDVTSDILLLQQGQHTCTVPVQGYQTLSSSALVFQSHQERLTLRSCTRPNWAQLIGRNSKDLFVELLWLGQAYRLYWQNPKGAGLGRWKSYHHGPVDMDAFGLSAFIGLAGKVMQRFRWIEAGTFLMGSPLDEPEREIWGKETLHEVTLSRGFWLGETTVSQEFWQAVMGTNPAQLQHADHPVENVTWFEVQEFLQRLNQLFPHLDARLPTEAEWEYACRAGSSSAFTFGHSISPEQANYNGTYPYHQGAKGLYRKQTVAEHGLPCNAWGLYAMHGNVWEWCQDSWQDDLHTEAVQDPTGPQSGDFRVVRGGSWFLGGKAVRSAVRGRFAPEVRNDRLGFRIARNSEIP